MCQRWVNHGRRVPTKWKGWRKSKKDTEGQAKTTFTVSSRIPIRLERHTTVRFPSTLTVPGTELGTKAAKHR